MLSIVDYHATAPQSYTRGCLSAYAESLLHVQALQTHLAMSQRLALSRLHHRFRQTLYVGAIRNLDVSCRGRSLPASTPIWSVLSGRFS
ncbi:hypothetical protein ASPCAL03704 [Aspergillus calidoustus]|uniref:Uncharacterized protein n=1 Tax=Aspergillus calidoustus TaxID=454130 RepID=A0A0U5FV24_ASPCI|nr:hypothetical protein ASPCAL03704 [Aspergillus calidoustus]